MCLHIEQNIIWLVPYGWCLTEHKIPAVVLNFWCHSLYEPLCALCLKWRILYMCEDKDFCDFFSANAKTKILFYAIHMYDKMHCTPGTFCNYNANPVNYQMHFKLFYRVSAINCSVMRCQSYHCNVGFFKWILCLFTLWYRCSIENIFQ